MSYVAGTLVTAEALQTEIENVFLTAPDVDTAQPVPFLEFLYSPQNRGSLEQQVAPGQGKVKTVQVIYMEEFADASVASDVSNPNCDTGATQHDNFQNYTIDTTENRAITRSFNRADLDAAFVSNPNYFSKLILKMMYAIERATDDKAAAEAVAFTGNWYEEVSSWPGYSVNGSNQLVVKTLKDSDAFTLAPFALQQIRSAATASGYNGPLYGFGGVAMKDYIDRVIVSAVADGGTDFQAMASRYGFGFARDQYMVDALGSENETLITMAGALQLRTYTGAEWRDGMPQVIQGSNYTQMRMVTPRVGLPVDLIVTDNCGTITVKVIATTKCVGLPSDWFNPSNKFEGVTFVNQVLVTNV